MADKRIVVLSAFHFMTFQSTTIFGIVMHFAITMVVLVLILVLVLDFQSESCIFAPLIWTGFLPNKRSILTYAQFKRQNYMNHHSILLHAKLSSII